MPEDDSTILAELLCARLCHDLAGPIGAVGTGAELLAEDAGDADQTAEAMALLASSAATAVHRLRLLRAALGSGGATVAAAQLRTLCEQFVASSGAGGKGWRLDWQDGAPDPWEPAAAKLLLNLLLVAQDCLARGGAIVVRARLAGQPLVSVAAEGPEAAPSEAAAGLSADGAAGLGPRGAQGYYLSGIAAKLGVAIRQTKLPHKVVFVAERARLPQQ